LEREEKNRQREYDKEQKDRQRTEQDMQRAHERDAIRAGTGGEIENVTKRTRSRERK